MLGFDYASGEDVMRVLLEVTAASSEKLCSSEAGGIWSLRSGRPLLPYLRHLDILVASFTHMVSMQKSYPATASAFGKQELASLVPSLNNVLLSPKVWEISRTPLPGWVLIPSLTDAACSLGALRK